MLIYHSTPLIRGRDGAYPVYLYHFLQDNPNVTIGQYVFQESLAEFGFYPVLPVTPPTGDVVTEGPPVFDADTQEWMQTWTSRDFTPAEIAANLLTAKLARKEEAQAILSADLGNGIPYPVDDIEYKVRVKSFDLATLLTIKTVVDQDGNTSQSSYPFQFIDGYKADFTHSQISSLILDVSRAHYGVMKTFWSYLDSVDNSTTIDAIPALPTSFI